MSHTGFTGILTVCSVQQSPIPLPPTPIFYACFIWRSLVVPSEPGCGEKCLTSIKMCAVMSLVDLTAEGVSYGTGGGGTEADCATN